MLLSFSVFPAGAEVQYNYIEDFTNPAMDDWLIYQNDFTDAPRIAESSFTFQDGFMGSLRDGESSVSLEKINIASRAQNFNYGAWRINASIDPTAEAWNFWVFLVDDPVYRGDVGDLRINHASKGIQTLISETEVGIDLDFLTDGAYDHAFPISEELHDYRFRQYDLIRTSSDFFVFVNGHRVANDSMDRLPTFVYPDLVSFTIATHKGSNTQFESVAVTDDFAGVCLELTTEPDCWGNERVNLQGISREGIVSIVILTTGFIVATTLFGYRVWTRRRLSKVIQITSGTYPEISGYISNIFDDKIPLYFILLGQRPQKIGDAIDSLTTSIPLEMHQFRHLLHPFRLSIMQQLYKSKKVMSIELRDELGLSPSEFYNTIKRMKRWGIITIFEDFDEMGLKRQFVAFEENGKREYEELLKLLKKFVDQATEFLPDMGHGDDLYPSS